MMYRIEYMADSFLSLDNDRSGPRYGARRSLRAGAVPLDAGKQQAHHRRADVLRVLRTHMYYPTAPRACHERFVTLAWRVSRSRPRTTSMRRAARSGRYRPSFRDTARSTARRK
jgi:hypothetical protein